MTDHSWRSYLTPEEAQDVSATEAYKRWAQGEVDRAVLKLSRIRNRAVKRAAAERKEGGTIVGGCG